MKFWMMLMVGLSVPIVAMAGQGSHLTCLKTCDPNFKVSVVGSSFVYSLKNNCTDCCDNTFGKHYGDCKMLYSECYNRCKQTNHYQNQNLDCKLICTDKKKKCQEQNAEEKWFSCPEN